MQGPRDSVEAAAAAVAWSIIATKHKQQSSNGGEANSVNTSKRFKHNRRCGLGKTRAAPQVFSYRVQPNPAQGKGELHVLRHRVRQQA